MGNIMKMIVYKLKVHAKNVMKRCLRGLKDSTVVSDQ